ncbi:MAG TPA: hypothetical protein VGB45_08715 [Abditibacterium sp.]|jgi:hypothetical protein
MAILNYTTKIDAAKTVGEIQAMRVKKGADSIRVNYLKGQPLAIEFETDTPTLGRQFYSYAPNVEGVLRALKSDPAVPSRFCDLEQARRVAWRIEKDWLEAQFAKIEAMQIPLEQMMLPYMVMGERPLYEAMKESHNKMLMEGPK